MDFTFLILFLINNYIRLHEWPGLIWIQEFRPVTVVMILAIVATVARRGRITKKDIFRTPHDWLVTGYCLWMIFTSGSIRETFGTVYPLYLFYIVTVLTLSDVDRIRRFITWWAMMIFAVAALAVLSQYGFDPTQSYDLTNGRMKGRLVLNTSHFENPNALGHSVVPAVLMLYFLFVWKRPLFSRIGSIPLFIVPLYCIYLTTSKGAYLSAFVSAVLSLVFGRSKAIQILILFMAMTVGWAGIKALPRMEEMESTKKDEAIQGRVASFTFGMEKLKSTWLTGIGKDRFIKVMQGGTGIYKASHSSYVQIGCEQGRGGLFLFLGILYCCLRTLFIAKTRDTTEERIRRLLFSVVVAYIISSWVVDFAYRPVFFLFCGAIAAFHRLLLQEQPEIKEDLRPAPRTLTPVPALTISGLGSSPVAAVPVSINQTTIAQTGLPAPSAPSPASQSGASPTSVPSGIVWNRFNLRDFLYCVLITYLVIQFWAYIMHKM